MPLSALLRSALRWTALSIAAVIALTLIAAAGADAGYVRKPITNLFSALLARRIRIDGPLHCHLLSTHPQVVADQVTIYNPPWMPDGVTARIQRLTLNLAFPGRKRLFRIDRLETQGAVLTLVRDAAGAANWQLQPPHRGRPALPLVRSLSMRNVQADLDDQRHHLKFHGIVSATDGRNENDPWLHINGVGQLNGSAVRFATVSDPLNVADPDRPYRFTFMERSSDAQLTGRGSLAGAFRFKTLQTSFEASGGNLHDLYMLAGITLVNTGPFHLTGALIREGDLTRFDHLQATTGDSDLSGTVTVESVDQRPKLNVDVASRVLRLADFGKGRGQSDAAPATPLLLSDSVLPPAAMQRSDAIISYHAQSLETARLRFQGLDAHATLQQGILNVDPLTATLLAGKLRAQLRVDARTDDPADTLQLQLNAIQVGQFAHDPQKSPRFDATLDAKLQISGHGASLHQLGASASGRLAVTVPRGILRASLAELSGLDLRGLGMFLSGNQRETPMRCGAATFDAVNGTFNSSDILLDTDEVLIRGKGSIALENEALQIKLAGHPKHTRLLRVHAPLLISGTLRHPTVGVETPRSVQLLDREQAQDVDCDALLAAIAPH